MLQIPIEKQHEWIRKTITHIVKNIEGNTPQFKTVMNTVPLNLRSNINVIKSLVEETSNTINHYAFELGSEKCARLRAYYMQLICDLIFDMSCNKCFDIKKVIVLLGFIAPEIKALEIRMLPQMVTKESLKVLPDVQDLNESAELMVNLVYSREKIPEVKSTLEEIRDSSVNFILNYLDPNNKNILNHSEDILVLLIARRLYNAMYWYMYGKQ